MNVLPVVAFAIAAAAPTPSVSVVVRGDAAPDATQAVPLLDLPVELRVASVPDAVSVHLPRGDVDERIAAARRAYVNADFAGCLKLLESDALLVEALGAWQRTTAARLLMWRTACLVGSGRKAAAHVQARQLAALGLEIPLDAAAVTPEVETVLAQGLKKMASAATVPVRVAIDFPALVSLDGRQGHCNAPCTMEVPEGMHVLRIDADGYEPEVVAVRLEGEPATVNVKPTPASPEVAASQWHVRYAHSPQVDSAASVQLLSTALRTPRLILVTAEAEAGEARLRGVLAIDGKVAARAERTGAPQEQMDALLRDLLVRGEVVEPAPPLYRRAGFWVAVGLAAAGAAAGTAIVVNRRVVTGVHFR